MRTRTTFCIAMWALVGALIANFWGGIFGIADKAIRIRPIVYTLASITQPVAAVVAYFHLPFGLTAAVAWNAGAFAVIGLIVEVLRRHKHALKTA